MILADISTGEIWMICLTAAMVVVMAVGTFWKKSNVEFERPVQVTVTEELHRTFAGKADFDSHVDEDKTAHLKLQDQINANLQSSQAHVSQRQRTVFEELKSVREMLDRKLEEKHTENSQHIIKLERSIGGLETATNYQNQELAGIKATLNRILERLPR